MRNLWTLVAPPARGQRRWYVAVVLAVVVVAPFVVVLTLLPQRGADARVPVAVVNLDEPVKQGDTYVAVGKLLTQNLVAADTVDWMLTDTATADAGLAAGDYLAVVTIPTDFSQTTTTLAGDAPQQSTLTVQTSTAHGYLGGIIAEALSAGIPEGVSAQLTQQFVQGTLDAFTQLNSGISGAADGAGTIAGGLSQATDGASALRAGTEQLSSGLGEIGRVLGALPAGARGLGDLSAAGAVASGDLAVRLLQRSGDVSASVSGLDTQLDSLQAIVTQMRNDPGGDAGAYVAQLQQVLDGGRSVTDGLRGESGALFDDAGRAGEVALGAAGVAAVSVPVADALGQLAGAEDAAASGAAQIAAGQESLAAGLGQLTDGSSQLADGLRQAADGIPAYTTDQQKDIAQVVARPITVSADSTGGPTDASASTVAAIAPVAQWLGAIGMFLVIAPFARSALAGASSARRIAGQGALVAGGVGVAQAVLIWGALALFGAPPDRFLAAGGFALVTGIAFALVHQALVAFLPRAGLVISLAFLGLQVVAAGTLTPQALAPSADGPLSILPLSIALQGTQDLVGGAGSGVLRAAVGLALWAVIGFVAAIVAVRRARARSLSVRELVRL